MMKTDTRRDPKGVRALLRGNWCALLRLELLYKLVYLVLLVPLFWLLFNLEMRRFGLAYLTNDTLIPFLLHWQTILLLMGILAACLLCFLVEFSSLIYVLDQSMQSRRTGVTASVVFGFFNAKRLLAKRNRRPLPTALCLFLAAGLMQLSFYITLWRSSDLLLRLVRQYPLIAAAGAGLLVVVFYTLMRGLFCLHYFTVEQCSGPEAIRRSRIAARGNTAKNLLSLLLMLLGQLLFLLATLALGLLCVWLCGRLFQSAAAFQPLFYTAVLILVSAALLLCFIFGTPVFCAVISRRFYTVRQKTELAPLHLPQQELPIRRRRLREVKGVLAVILTVALLGNAAYYYGVSIGRIHPSVEYLRSVQVTAHRGAAGYPENTIAAFQAAADAGADWIELDVQQSQDGVLFVMHDSSFYRTAGIDAYAWELPFDEIEQLDVGSKYGTDFFDTKIPSLKAVLEFAKAQGVQLNIELKPTGHETDFGARVVDLLRETGMEDRCVVASQNYALLEQVKQYDESIRTVYVMSIAYGSIGKLSAADDLSVRMQFATPALMKRAHRAGKQVYVWTINSEYWLRRMIVQGADNLITDNLMLAQRCVVESKTSSLVNRYLEFLLRLGN